MRKERAGADVLGYNAPGADDRVPAGGRDTFEIAGPRAVAGDARQRRLRIDAAVRAAIERGHPMPVRDQRRDEMATEKHGAAQDEDVHAGSFSASSCPPTAAARSS